MGDVMQFQTKIRLVFVAICALALQACATASTKVLVAADTSLRNSVTTIRVERGEDTVPVPPEPAAYLEKRINDYLFASNSRFSRGDGIILRYRFLKLDEGDRALRYIVGFGAGKGEMTVEVTYLDMQGTELARAEFESELSMGFFGGDFDQAISSAAKEIADYTKANF